MRHYCTLIAHSFGPRGYLAGKRLRCGLHANAVGAKAGQVVSNGPYCREPPKQPVLPRIMKLEPFVRVNGVAFSASREDVIQAHGTPHHEESTASGLTLVDFGETLYRFLGNGQLDEISAQSRVLSLGPVVIPFQNLAGFVRQQDAGAFDSLGFLVSPRYGLAFIPYKRYWITALSRSAVLRWKGL